MNVPAIPEMTLLKVRSCIDRLRDGDQSAREELILATMHRLRKMVNEQIFQFTKMPQGGMSGDVLSHLYKRLQTVLNTVQINDPAHFFNLSGKHIRYTLLDLANEQKKHEFDRLSKIEEPVASETGPADRASKFELRRKVTEKVEDLPPDEREVVNLLYYQGLSREEAADVLQIDVSTVGRRLVRAIRKLHDSLGSFDFF